MSKDGLPIGHPDRAPKPVPEKPVEPPKVKPPKKPRRFGKDKAK